MDCKQLWQQYRTPIIGGLGGLLTALAVISVGIWKTLLIVLFIGLGIGLALYLQKTGLLKQLFK